MRGCLKLFFGFWAPMRITFFFFFNDTATTEIYTLSLHDALPISQPRQHPGDEDESGRELERHPERDPFVFQPRSEEHTSELQSRQYLVCRLLLEKKNDPEGTRGRGEDGRSVLKTRDHRGEPL